MRRTLLALGVVTLLAVPAVASSDAPRGTTDDYRISMTLKLSGDGAPEAIKRFRLRKLDVACADDEAREVGARIASMRVNDRNRFRGTHRRPGNTVRVRGKVSENLKRIRGVIRARGDFGELEDCDSGRVRWRARIE